MGVELARQPPSQDDADRVGQADQFVEVGGDEQHGKTFAACVLDVIPDRGLRADVDTARRVRGDEDARCVRHLAPEDELLLVAARQRPGGHVDARRAHVVLADDALRVLLRRAGREAPALARGGLSLVAEHAVLPQRRTEKQRVTVTVLGDVADAAVADLLRRPGRDVVVADDDVAAVGAAHAEDRLDEFGLAVALDTGDADDLAGADDEVDVRQQRRAAGAVGERQPVEAHDDAVGDGRFLRLGGGQLRADHEFGELLARHRRALDAVDRRAAADDGDVVGDAAHLVELVRDEQHREAFGLHLGEVREQFVDLLRHEHGRRLVEDEDLRPAVEHLEDLDALTGADAEVGDEHVGVDAEPVGLRDARDLRARLRPDAVQLLGAEDDVLEDGEVVREHEVLEHHADAGLDRVLRRRERDLVTVDADRALVGLLHAVEDLHERRLAGTVLPHDGVDRAALDLQVQVGVRDDAGESLRDALQVDGEGPLRGRADVGRRGRRRRGIGGVDDAHSCSNREGPASRTPACRTFTGWRLSWTESWEP